ncbi:scavenger receptor class B member 1 isoform X1 [Onthophagus taurus]|uniref:scavenger receptor class B member 1 isoform X1 n=1 Tax=Onthophagus taurus TaxID=166361 RepID=UPI0039BE711E
MLQQILSKSRATSFFFGFFLTSTSIFLSIWTPFELLMNERLQMRKGLPAYEWWLKPPDATLKIYIFNVTNSERFLMGLDEKMVINQVGPIVFREDWVHSNVIFNSNSTISYNVKKTPKYDEKENELSLNSVVVVPNMAFLGSASFLTNSPYLIKFGFKSMISMLETQPFINLTIQNLLYNFTDPLLEFVHRYIPSLAPTDNMGILNNLYERFGDNVTAFMGTKSGHSLFSLIDRYNGEKGIPGYNEQCKDVITNASEAVTFNQFVTKDQDLLYYRKLLCRVAKLIYQKEVKRYGLLGYKFVVPGDVFNRTFPPEDDCYKSNPTLLDGLSDLSNCLYSFPLAGSFPHFLYGNQQLQRQVLGLTPQEAAHRSYVIVEPITGLPLEEKAMIQLNIHVKSLSGFNNNVLNKFSDSIVPMFWLEFSMLNLPYHIILLIYSALTVKYLQWVFIIIIFYLGLKLIRKSWINNVGAKTKISKDDVKVETLEENESFLMKNHINR